MELFIACFLFFTYIFTTIIFKIKKISLELLYIGLCFSLFFTFIFYLITNPTISLYPYNLYVEACNDKKVFYSDSEKKEIFPSSISLEKNWKKIRDEFYNLKIEEANIGKNFIKEDEDFWKGWNTITLRSFGKDNEENMNKCPTLKKILKNDNEISTAIFSILEPGKTIPSHYGPFKGVLRYHLGLEIPKGTCFISVDGETYDWKEGEGVLFDETYKHFVKNETSQYRVILFLDVKRPDCPRLINDLLIYLMGISPYNI